ncbi:DUF2515 family protein [Bacillaceae bacterium SIJ1]|uniref:DUF2515 family protein n=1 Tax=Litoribacterium kuwaitense TaxID=1398745 RepID=UPI0013E9BCFF|nr:DUF2515 family protein [Litoribacterium kuwaitense]NGP43747.1 DUF2515 family protein [Litoribacterium kuwaitense]
MNEHRLIQTIQRKTTRLNVDNISRTEAYRRMYHRLPELHWALLAASVSRNAGYQMTDLWHDDMIHGLSERVRWSLFMAYERANWLIFQDAYPQLLLYEFSCRLNKPLFHLLDRFHVSSFMYKHWMSFWKERQSHILTHALITNEQHVITRPILQEKRLKEVFTSPLFYGQQALHESVVLLPTLHGVLYGQSVQRFTHIKARIQLGRKLYQMMFFRPYSRSVRQFAQTVVHTGKRLDYQKYIHLGHDFSGPLLRAAVPMIRHQRFTANDWFIHLRYLEPKHHGTLIDEPLNRWFDDKRKQLTFLLRMLAYFPKT